MLPLFSGAPGAPGPILDVTQNSRTAGQALEQQLPQSAEEKVASNRLRSRPYWKEKPHLALVVQCMRKPETERKSRPPEAGLWGFGV